MRIIKRVFTEAAKSAVERIARVNPDKVRRMARKQIDRSFSLLLAEELLRTELNRHYGQSIQIFQCNIEATKPKQKEEKELEDITDVEVRLGRYDTNHRERYMKISGIIGPFERLYPTHPESDKRHRLRRVEAECRLFTIEGGVVQWMPHYLEFTVTDDCGENLFELLRVYSDGCIDGFTVPKDSENPREIMCASQTDTHYPSIYPGLHGRK